MGEDLHAQAADEWAAVENLQIEREALQPEKAYTAVQDRGPSGTTINFKEAVKFMESQDLSEQKKNIVTTNAGSQGLVARLFGSCFGPSKLTGPLHSEMENIFALALVPFSSDEPVHMRALQTIYLRLTGATFDCPRFGSHWEDIGFQGNDPATDLRGVGMLGLLHLLHLLDNYDQLAVWIYKLSKDETQNFPLCVVSLSMSKIALESLREQKLNGMANSAGSVWEVVNDHYAAAFYQMYLVWSKESKTIADFGYVLSHVTKLAKANPAAIVAELHTRRKQDQEVKARGAARPAATPSTDFVDF